VLKVIDKHAPWISVKVKGQHLPWIDADLTYLFKQKDKAREKYRLSKDALEGAVYKQLRNKCTTKTRNAKSNYYTNFCQIISMSLRSFGKVFFSGHLGVFGVSLRCFDMP